MVEDESKTTNMDRPCEDLDSTEEVNEVKEELARLPLISVSELISTPLPVVSKKPLTEFMKPVTVDIKKEDWVVDVSFWDKGYLFIRKTQEKMVLLTNLIKFYFLLKELTEQIKGKKLMVTQDKNTTVVGIIVVIATIVKLVFGIEIPQGIQDSLYAIAIFLIGLFAADSKKGTN